MPPLDAWLQFTIRVPLLLLFTFLTLGVIAAAGIVAWRLLRQARELSSEVRDLRARLAARERERERWAVAREAYRHFIYNLSHEVSNPLQSIQTNLDNMARCTVDDARRWRRYLGTIAAEVQRLSGLTERLRLLSHLEAPDAPLVREPVNLKGVVEEVIMALFEQAEAQGVRLRYVGPERPPRVLGDRDGLYQVLMNLVDNGIKYSRPEGGEVIVSVQQEPDRLRVRVSDEGVGISEEDLPHIFDTAYRVPEARSFRRTGSGLGLAIVKRIVERHDGEVRVESRPGAGTTFSFYLPLYSTGSTEP